MLLIGIYSATWLHFSTTCNTTSSKSTKGWSFLTHPASSRYRDLFYSEGQLHMAKIKHCADWSSFLESYLLSLKHISLLYQKMPPTCIYTSVRSADGCG